jgi:hypothetical protein
MFEGAISLETMEAFHLFVITKEVNNSLQQTGQ